MVLLEPLYHLPEARDQAWALGEALRVLKPGGLLFAAAIPRFASSLDGLLAGFHDDPAFRAILEKT